MNDPKIIVALITGVFAIAGSLVTFVLFLLQSKVTQRLEKSVKEFDAELRISSEVELRLYERAMQEIALYQKGLIETFIRLGDYNNGVKKHGSDSEVENRNNGIFHGALNDIRFPGIYIPNRIEGRLEKMRMELLCLKQEIYNSGKESDENLRDVRFKEVDFKFDALERKGKILINDWKKELLHPRGILVTILDG